MPKDDTKTDDTNVALDPKLQALMPSGAEIYDALMAPIDADLLSANLPILTRKNANESEKEKQERIKRHEKAFADYDKAYEAWITDLRCAVKEKRRSAYEAAEEEGKEKETSQLSDIEEQFETADSPSL